MKRDALQQAKHVEQNKQKKKKFTMKELKQKEKKIFVRCTCFFARLRLQNPDEECIGFIPTYKERRRIK